MFIAESMMDRALTRGRYTGTLAVVVTQGAARAGAIHTATVAVITAASYAATLAGTVTSRLTGIGASR